MMLRSRLPSILAVVLLCVPFAGCSDAPPPAEDAPESVAESPLEAKITEAEEMYWRGEFDSARVVWREALIEAEALPDLVAEPRILTWLGLAAWRLGDYTEARRLGEQGLALKLERGQRHKLSRSYNALGLLALDQGRLVDAADLLSRALEAARAENDERGIARAAGNLGLIHTDYGEFDSARESFNAMLAAGRLLGDARVEGNALNNLGMLDVRVGDPRSAIEPLAEARRLYRSIDYSTGEQNALSQLGTAYNLLGDPARAFAALDSALELSRRHGHRKDEAENLALIGGLFAELGDPHRALQYYAAARKISDELELLLETGNTRRSEAAIHARLGRVDQAAASARDALEAHRTAGASFQEILSLLVIAEVSQAAGRAGEAEADLRRARRLASTLGSRLAQANVALTEARVAERANRPRAVLHALSGSPGDLFASDATLAWEAHALRARAFTKLEQIDSAVVAGHHAVTAIERVRGSLGAGPLRTTYTADRSLVYSDLAVNLLRLGRTREAFEVADAARGRALVEHLSSVRREIGAATAVGDLLAAEQLLRRIDALVSRLTEMEQQPPNERSTTAATSHDVAARLAAARTEYETLLLRIAQRHPGAATLLSTRRVPVEEVRSALQPGELLVQYLVTPDRLLLFAVNSAGLHTLESEIPASALAGRVRLARDLLSQRDAGAAAAHGVTGGLYDVLFGPLQRAGLLRDAQRLIIVPHQGLTYLPFAAVRDPRTGRYLSDEHSILQLPSAGALPVLRSGGANRGPAATSVVATGFAPLPERLPATQREAYEFRRTVPRSRVRLGPRATEPALRQALAQGGLVHIATHGVMNAGNPLFSRIELFRGQTGAPDDDGRLEVHELIGLTIRSPLVFLSGCETGVGSGWATDFAQREDYATLARAFLYAGARNVVATLWRIDDEGAAVFAEAFYRHLAAAAPAEALARAQQEMRHHPRYHQPYYWAGYTISGEGLSIPLAPRRWPFDRLLALRN